METSAQSVETSEIPLTVPIELIHAIREEIATFPPPTRTKVARACSQVSKAFYDIFIPWVFTNVSLTSNQRTAALSALIEKNGRIPPFVETLNIQSTDEGGAWMVKGRAEGGDCLLNVLRAVASSGTLKELFLQTPTKHAARLDWKYTDSSLQSALSLTHWKEFQHMLPFFHVTKVKNIPARTLLSWMQVVSSLRLDWITIDDAQLGLDPKPPNLPPFPLSTFQWASNTTETENMLDVLAIMESAGYFPFAAVKTVSVVTGDLFSKDTTTWGLIRWAADVVEELIIRRHEDSHSVIDFEPTIFDVMDLSLFPKLRTLECASSIQDMANRIYCQMKQLAFFDSICTVFKSKSDESALEELSLVLFDGSNSVGLEFIQHAITQFIGRFEDTFGVDSSGHAPNLKVIKVVDRTLKMGAYASRKLEYDAVARYINELGRNATPLLHFRFDLNWV